MKENDKLKLAFKHEEDNFAMNDEQYRNNMHSNNNPSISEEFNTKAFEEKYVINEEDFNDQRIFNNYKEGDENYKDDIAVVKQTGYFKNFTLSDYFTGYFYYEIFSHDLELMKNRIKGNKCIFNVVKAGKYVNLCSNYTAYYYSTLLKVQDALKLPVFIERLNYSRNFTYFEISNVEFLTLISLTSKVNCLKYPSKGYIYLMKKSILIFSFSEKILRIEIQTENLEDYILLECASTSERYLNLDINFCLKAAPKIYTTNHQSEIENILHTRNIKKLKHLNSLEWTRLTNAELPELIERFDVKVTITQDLEFFHINDTENGYENVSPNSDYDITSEIKNLSNICKKYDSGNLTCKLTDSHMYKVDRVLQVVAQAVNSYPVRFVCTNILETKLSIGIGDILYYFRNLEFSKYFMIIVLVSNKGRYLINKLSTENLDKIKIKVERYCKILNRVCNKRFEPIGFIFSNKYCETHCDITEKMNENNYNQIRTAIITPTRIIYELEYSLESNRVLRRFDPDKFLRIQFKEDDLERINNVSYRNLDLVFEYFRKLLYNGLSVGSRKYFFLSMTTSQMRDHGAWMITPYVEDNILIGANYVKDWIGDFSNIKNIGKYASRIGLALSNTIVGCIVNDYIEVGDIERCGYCFSDGIGLISYEIATKISTNLKLNIIPSCFQIRFGGYKGVVVWHPSQVMERVLVENDLLSFNGGSAKDEIKSLASDNSCNEHSADDICKKIRGELLDKNIKLRKTEMILRKSMNKFLAKENTLEVITFSKPIPAYLNRQIIFILEGLGINKQVFIDLMDVQIYNILQESVLNFEQFIKKNCPIFNKVSKNAKFFRKLTIPILKKVLDDINNKSRIFIKEGRCGIGVVDEMGLLEEDEIFCMFKITNFDEFKNPKTNLECYRCKSLLELECKCNASNNNVQKNIYGQYFVPKTLALIAKNPVMHPGDIRTVKCVDIPELHYLKDVIVFSRKGKRPLFNQCSGSDLDGDIYTVIWDINLLPKATVKPYNYVDTTALIKDKVLLSDIVNFYIRHMRYFQLGQIANNYFAISDKHSIFSKKSLKLSEIFNKSIDFIKTGNLTSIPLDLIPKEFPDFMNKVPSYKSNLALGILFRRSLFDFDLESYCEKQNSIFGWKLLVCDGYGITQTSCNGCNLDSDHRSSFILLNNYDEYAIKNDNKHVANRKYLFGGCKTSSGTNKHLKSIYSQYKQEIYELIDRHKVKSEEELFIHFEALQDLKLIVPKFKEMMKSYSFREFNKGCDVLDSFYLLFKDFKGSNIEFYRSERTGFEYNSNIHLIDRSDLDDGLYFKENSDLYVIKDPDVFYTKNLQEACILCDKKRILGFVAEAANFNNCFSEFFNLLILSKYFLITEIDDIFSFFEKILQVIQRTIKCSEKDISKKTFFHSKFATANEKIIFYRSALPFCKDPLLFKCLVLFLLDFNILKKCEMLKEKEERSYKDDTPSFKICKTFKMIVSGMLDENEDIQFIQKESFYVPVLRNTGECSLQYYKDTVRDFLINILYSTDNLKYYDKLKHVKEDDAFDNTDSEEKNDLINIKNRFKVNPKYNDNRVELNSSIETVDISKKDVFKEKDGLQAVNTNNVSKDRIGHILEEDLKNIILQEVVTNTMAKEIVRDTTLQEVERDPTLKEVVTDSTSKEVVTNTILKEGHKDYTLQEVLTNTTAKEIEKDPTLKEVGTNTTLKEIERDPTLKELVTDTSLKEIESGDILLKSIENNIFEGFTMDNIAEKDLRERSDAIKNVHSLSKKLKNPSCKFEISLMGGQFLFKNISEQYLYDKLNITELEKLLVDNVIQYEFRLDFKSRKYKMITDNLSISFKENIYHLTYANGVMQSICKNILSNGSLFLINNGQKCDLKIDIIRKEIIFNDKIDCLRNEEQFMKYVQIGSLFADDAPCILINGRKYQATNGCVIIDKFENFIDLKINLLTIERKSFNISNSFYKEVMLETYKFQDEKFCLFNTICYECAYSEFEIDNIENIEFDDVFKRLWRVYINKL